MTGWQFQLHRRCSLIWLKTNESRPESIYGRSPLRKDITYDNVHELLATIIQAGITADQCAPNVVPALIADLGDEAAWRYVEFFTANIRNPHTRGLMPGLAPGFSPGARNVA